jgi:hypothetical protein
LKLKGLFAKSSVGELDESDARKAFLTQVWGAPTRSRPPRHCRAPRNDNIFPRQGYGKRRKQIAAHVDATEPSEFAVLPGDGLGKGTVYIKPNDAHASPLDWLVNETGAGGQHDIY